MYVVKVIAFTTIFSAKLFCEEKAISFIIFLNSLFPNFYNSLGLRELKVATDLTFLH